MGNSKYIFILLLSTQWLGNPLFSQEQEFKRIFYNYTAAPEESNETRILEITMWESHRFTYKSWLDYLDCFSWRDYSGTWSEVNDTIYFYDQIIRNGFDISTEFRKGKDTSNLEIQFTTSDDAEVQGAHVEFRFSYPGYTEKFSREFILDSSGTIHIPISEIPSMQELNNIYLYYYQNKDNIKSGSISLYYLLGKGRNELHNKIDIEIIQNPLIDTVHRVTTGIIQNHFLHILGTQHTKTKLPFIIEEITFHDYYGIRNN